MTIKELADFCNRDTKTVRRNVALPSWLNYEAERAGVNVSMILQEALMSTLKLEKRI